MTFKLYQIYKAPPKDGKRYWAWKKVPVGEEPFADHRKIQEEEAEERVRHFSQLPQLDDFKLQRFILMLRFTL